MKMMILSAALLAAAGSATAFAADKPADAAPKQTDKSAPDYVRCVRTLETGSLVKARRVCHTNAEWRGITREENRAATDMIQGGPSGSQSGQ